MAAHAIDRMVRQLVGGRMYPLTLDGLDQAMRDFVRLGLAFDREIGPDKDIRTPRNNANRVATNWPAPAGALTLPAT